MLCSTILQSTTTLTHYSNAIKDAVHSLPGYCATRQLAELYGLDPDMKLEESGIQCLLLDDGLRGVQEMANDLSWHGMFSNGSVYRLFRIEPVAEGILKPSLQPIQKCLAFSPPRSTQRDPVVVGFESVVCYRTGLDDLSSVEKSIVATVSSWKNAGGSDVLRLADKALNNFVVSIATESNKPDEFQFHTGLGDADIALTLSSPAYMQPMIEAYSKVTFVLHEVLLEFVQKGEMSERQASNVTKKALFENANRVYNLSLEPASGGTVRV